MSTALRKPMSVAEFLAWEERQELRYEFDGFQPVAMTGDTFGHDQITSSLRQALGSRLAGSPCRPFGPNVKILAGGKVRYPDVGVTCSPIPRGTTVIDNPIIVFEVISADSARTDRIEKVRDYLAAPSIQRYVILEQTIIGATIFVRQADAWIATAVMDGETLGLPEIGVELPLADCYAGLQMDQPTAD